MSRARKVYRYEVPAVSPDPFWLKLPGPSKVVCVGYHTERGPSVWVECQPGWPEADYMFRWFGTGQAIPDDMEFIATVFDGLFVWHLYGIPRD